MKIQLLAVIIILTLLPGCYQAQTYISRPDPVAGVNIYTPDGGKVLGTWAYIVDDSVKSASRQIKASSHPCSLHNYQIEDSDSLTSSIRKAMESLFESTISKTSVPSAESATSEKIRGVVVIKLDDFSPKFSCSMGQVEGHCSATTDLSLSVTLIDYATNLRRNFNASSQRTTDGGSGELCAGVSNVISESVKRASKDVLERVGEKIAASVDWRK